GEALVPGERRFAGLSCKGLAFSADGKALAGLYSTGLAGRLVLWDVATGNVTADHHLPRDPQSAASNGFGYQGRPLEWLPDGSGLLAYGQLLLDARSGAVVWTLPREQADANPRRALDAGHIATVKGDPRERR